MDVTINPSFRHRRRVSTNKAGVTVGQIQRKEMRLLLNPADHNHGFAEIRLGVAGGVGQRHKHLSPAPAMFPDVILDRRVAAHEAMLIAQPLKNPFGSVPLLAVPVEVFLQPLIDEAGEGIELRPLDLRRSLITGWD
jgi:hypothetical protein